MYGTRPPSRSVALPLPSSPHWAPISTTAGIGSWFSSQIGTRRFPAGRDGWGGGAVGWEGIGMPSVELDLRRLGPTEAPRPEDLRAAADAESLLVRGSVPALAATLQVLLKAGRTAQVPVSWQPAQDKESLGLARDLGVGTGEARDLTLVRDDHGGVLLHHGRIEAAGDSRGSLSRRLACRPIMTTSGSPTGRSPASTYAPTGAPSTRSA